MTSIIYIVRKKHEILYINVHQLQMSMQLHSRPNTHQNYQLNLMSAWGVLIEEAYNTTLNNRFRFKEIYIREDMH